MSHRSIEQIQDEIIYYLSSAEIEQGEFTQVPTRLLRDFVSSIDYSEDYEDDLIEENTGLNAQIETTKEELDSLQYEYDSQSREIASLEDTLVERDEEIEFLQECLERAMTVVTSLISAERDQALEAMQRQAEILMQRVTKLTSEK